MATSTETATDAQPGDKYIPFETSIKYDGSDYKYASYLPHHVPGRQPPLQEFEHHDPGARADPDKKALLSGTPGAAFEEITPAVGTEVRGGGLQLSRLTAAQRDELALLAAERGVVVFRDQDLADAGPEAQRALGRHFGPLHVHQHGGQVRGFPELLPVYRDFAAGAVDNEIKNNVSSVKWHSDMSYEINGMGTTIFFCLDTPRSGGDTLYLSTTAAYENLSEDFRKRLHGLYATHSGFDQAKAVDHQERYIRDPIETVHPVIRTHPVTRKNSLYVNRLYTRKIVGWKEEESATLLNFLYNHIEHGQDWHIRVHWTPGTVVVYDNRVTQHSALRDFKVKEGETKRHMLRITPQAERPFFDPSV